VSTLLAASLLLVFLAVACGKAEAPSPTATATAQLAPSPSPAVTPAGPSPTPAGTAVPNVCKTNPSPVDPADPNIIVRSPEQGTVVTSPLRITGLARVFEAQFNVTLYGELGGVIAETAGMAEEGQVLSPFEVELTFAVGREQPACLWVYDLSAKDGSRIDVVQVPIALAPPAQPAPSVISTPAPTPTPSREAALPPRQATSR
jgi:hypothetical protein